MSKPQTVFALPEKVAQRLAALPIWKQPREVEEAWWARVFAERGAPDPATARKEKTWVSESTK